MANKTIDELTAKSDFLTDDDLLLVYDSEEAGSEKTKKVAMSDYMSVINIDTTAFISTTGSDVTGDGTSGNPWASITKAFTWLSNKRIDDNASFYIQLANGTYNSVTPMIYQHPSVRIRIIGDLTTPSNVVLNFDSDVSAISIYKNNYLYIGGIRIAGTGNTGAGFSAANFGKLYLDKCEVQDFHVGLNCSSQGGIICDEVISTSNNYGTYCTRQGNIFCLNGSITNNVTWGAATNKQARILLESVTYTGNGNGNGTSGTSDGQVTVV